MPAVCTSPAAVGCFPAVGCYRKNKAKITAARSAEVPVPALRVSTTTATPFLSDLKKKCATPQPVLMRVVDAMAMDLRVGLAVEGGGDLPMLPSFVESLPTGKETGLFYALDLGGTNFRVLRVQLGGNVRRVVGTEYDQVSLPRELMFGTTEELFDFIASRLGKFAEKEGDGFQIGAGKKREIGFTFSFPVKQTGIDSGILIKWTKGFKVSGTAGRDVVACLNEAMERQKLDMRVSALVNDTVSTLAGAHYWDNDVAVGVILGTGTNACYIEEMNNIPKLRRQTSNSGKTIINTEWGAFSRYLPLTEFDKDVDAASVNPGEQIFEKTISGMYLGEIVRRALLHAAKTTALFGNSVPEKLSVPFSLSTPNLSAMQQDNSDDLTTVEGILHDAVGVYDPSLEAKKLVVDVCDTFVKRGGRLAGAGIVGILQKLNEDSKGYFLRKRRVVAMDGGLYEKHLQYKTYLHDAVAELLGPEISKNVVIEHTKGGSGIGAALMAAANSKATNGTDSPILYQGRSETVEVLEYIIEKLNMEKQEVVLSLWLHHFTANPQSDWPKLQSLSI